MKIAIRHELLLPAPEIAGRSVQHLLLTPPGGQTQKVLEWAIEAEGIGRAASFIDGFGNRAHLINQARRDGPLLFVAEGIIETRDHHGVVGKITGEPLAALFLRTTPLTEFSGETPVRPDDANRIAYLHRLMAEVHTHFGGDRVDAPAVQSQSSAGQSQSQSSGGQSQSQSSGAATPAPPAPPPASLAADPPGTAHAHLFIARARAAGIPARFVTGYVAAEEDNPGFHCWAEACDPGLGWIGFDPLLNYCPSDWHVRLAIGLDAVGTVPVRAVPTLSASTSGDVSVDIVASAGQ
jgi:hypothetical protein